MDSEAPTLFLHGGPGLSAIAERALYGNQLPIHWWDQPRSVVLYASPFEALVDAAQEEVERLSLGKGRPVNLVAHSFGAHLALRLAMRVPEKLGKILLLEPVYDVGGALLRLVNRLLPTVRSTESLRIALEEFTTLSDYSRLAKLATQITGIANFADLYWSPEADSRRRWYVDLLTHRPVVDLNTFEVVVEDFWQAMPPVMFPAAVQNGVHVVLGRNDPLLDIAAEREVWTTLFPQAVCHEVDSGHFVHLEKSAAVWWTTQ